jgi:hypothetical protein
MTKGPSSFRIFLGCITASKTSTFLGAREQPADTRVSEQQVIFQEFESITFPLRFSRSFAANFISRTEIIDEF